MALRLARNPLTGATAPAVLIGAIVPGVGDPANGIVHAGKNGTPRGLIDNRGIQWGPRFGLAYAMNEKTVFRAGGGVFYERIATSAVGYTTNFLTSPPDVQLSQIYYGNLADIGSSAGALFPLQITQLAKDGHVPTTYNFNAGIQRELPCESLAGCVLCWNAITAFDRVLSVQCVAVRKRLVAGKSGSDQAAQSGWQQRLAAETCTGLIRDMPEAA